ncbi:MAG: hypothetical protein CFE31_18065 [Rhizobiales bacterium PAR1]|nr:MAG: hypothetical protein CFE31_18065 [Rhizobiales bacterium PAR1]
MSWGGDAGIPSTLYLRYQPPRPPPAEPYTVWREAKFYAALAAVLGAPPISVEAGKMAILEAVRASTLPFAEAIRYFVRCVALESQLAASASGGLAGRTFPPLEEAWNR